ncbi:hypothetical protein Vretifemale_21058 [Volvox reticuliferus]|uniref:Secreted protein n=1 Tax=Volvox reticuliferus TaxID=1737510 RepID=A0A8J4D4M7_9CHLO|nr:hypothetical protein Vretifemale_21058 [Volvox reticuliferus]
MLHSLCAVQLPCGITIVLCCLCAAPLPGCAATLHCAAPMLCRCSAAWPPCCAAADIVPPPSCTAVTRYHTTMLHCHQADAGDGGSGEGDTGSRRLVHGPHYDVVWRYMQWRRRRGQQGRRRRQRGRRQSEAAGLVTDAAGPEMRRGDGSGVMEATEAG